MEENGKPVSADGEKQNETPDLGKFKSVDALLRAYGELEAEFTRRSQRLKALEDAKSEPHGSGQTQASDAARQNEELYRAVNENEGVRARVLSDYLASLKGVSLLGNSGVGVTAPANSPKSISEAGGLALRYLRGNKN